MIVNLFSLKETNGMFFYAIDYLNQFSNQIDCVVVNKKYRSKFENKLSGFNDVIYLGFFSFLVFLFKCSINKVFIYCPTPHPIPFWHNQLVVVHDSYPFTNGKLSYFKRLLFTLSCLLSRCSVGYINKSDCYSFISSVLFDKWNSFMYLPNRIPDISLNKKISLNKYSASNSYLQVGLFGTDSPKKNYEELFLSMSGFSDSNKIKFIIYGHYNYYAEKLLSEYNDLNISIIESDKSDLSMFLENIHLVVSVANNEGFGRPIAAAIKLGIPSYLIENNVNKEFFSAAALFSTVQDLAVGIIQSAKNGVLIQTELDVLIDKNHQDFCQGVQSIVKSLT